MTIKKKYDYIVYGLGTSGQAVASFLLKNSSLDILLLDSCEFPPLQGDFKLIKNADTLFGTVQNEILFDTNCIVISPGISLSDLPIKDLKDAGVQIISEIELFIRHDFNKHKLIGITGSNGKSTVTSMVEHIVNASEEQAIACGNFGIPIISLLESEADWLIIELSSFQLETTLNMPLEIAVILNITEDHLDRHFSIENYAKIKQRIYNNAKQCLYNNQEILSKPLLSEVVAENFGTEGDWSYKVNKSTIKFLYHNEHFIDLTDFCLKGTYNIENALCATAIAHYAGISSDIIQQALSTFNGLPHRTQFIAKIKGVSWYNDSKATTPAAALASLKGIADTTTGKIILIIGGRSKGASFKNLCAATLKYCRCVILLGEAKDEIQRELPKAVNYVAVSNLQQAVKSAAKYAKLNDAVLLAPACTSFDMFENFIQRGEIYNKCIGEL